MTFFDQWSGFGWLAFQSWAVYFLAGYSLKGGTKAFIGYFIGLVFGYVTILLRSKYEACVANCKYNK